MHMQTLTCKHMYAHAHMYMLIPSCTHFLPHMFILTNTRTCSFSPIPTRVHSHQYPPINSHSPILPPIFVLSHMHIHAHESTYSEILPSVAKVFNVQYELPRVSFIGRQFVPSQKVKISQVFRLCLYTTSSPILSPVLCLHRLQTSSDQGYIP